MQSVAEAPPHGAEPPSALVGPRRPRRALPAIALVAVALITAFLIFLTNYDPLCHGPCTGSGGVQGIGVVTVEDLGYFTAPNDYSFSAVRVRHRPGGRFRFLFTLSNLGPLGVTITGIGPSETPSGSWVRYADVRVAPLAGSGRERAFRAFSLAGRSREFVNVWVTVEMQGCMREHSSTGLGGVPITYRVLGFARHTTVNLPESIEVAGGPSGTCS
jgi:hypothetical protein